MKTANRVFLDTAYVIALVNKKDHYHEKARQLAEKLQAAKTRFITTDAILLEIGNALAKVNYRHAAVELIDSLIDESGCRNSVFFTRVAKQGHRFLQKIPR